MNANYDIIITGAGLVGASTAVALQHSGLRIAILETHLPEITNPSVTDSRPLSLAYGSQKILNTLGVWPELMDLAVPIQTVHVSEQNRFGTLGFYAREENVPALGYVVPFSALQSALYQHAARQNNVHFISINQLTHIDNKLDGVTVTVQTIDGEKKLHAGLLIGADGTHSTTRRLLGINSEQTSVDELALTLTVQLPQPHQQVAYERFTEAGILAVLPLRNPHHCQIVWTLTQSMAATVNEWDDRQLADYVQKSFSGRLHNLQIVARGNAFPLQTMIAQEQIRTGVVLLGNAAHTIYPLAAQGFNLGLRDVATLVDVLATAHDEQKMLGDLAVLESYVAWRRSDQHWISGLTTGISQLFGLHVPLLGTLRSAGLLAMDLFPPLKHRLAKRLMGLSGRLPRLARGISLWS